MSRILAIDRLSPGIRVGQSSLPPEHAEAPATGRF